MITTLSIVVAVIAALIHRFLRIAGVGAAYKAKALCSALFVTGLELDLEKADEVSGDDYRVMRLFRARVDRGSKTVTASFFGLRARTAVYRPGLGASLAFRPCLRRPLSTSRADSTRLAPGPRAKPPRPPLPPP